MLGASLSEVWGDDFKVKPKKKKRNPRVILVMLPK